MRLSRLPLSYDECRSRFRHSAWMRRQSVASFPLTARGPDDQLLTVDVLQLGATTPQRALIVMSGVHGVEGFIGSTLQCDLIERFDPSVLPDDMAVLVIHAVNPWGMAWSRRQNESNVDLNRNWMRDETEPADNPAYDALHALACPDTPTIPAPEELLGAAATLVAEHGLPWIRDGITKGQYRHPDGLHFGGDRTEESNVILHHIVTERLAGVGRLLVMDLHSGHGPSGAVTCLSSAAPGSDQDRFLRDDVGADNVEATTDNPGATTSTKSGQIAKGIGAALPDATCFATAVEFGTASDEAQLIATCQEQWVYRHGDRDDPEHADAVWAYRCCFAPDDPAWEAAAIEGGRRHLDSGIAAVATWTA